MPCDTKRAESRESHLEPAHRRAPGQSQPLAIEPGIALGFRVRPAGGSHRLVAAGYAVEHVHDHPFATYRDAYRFLCRVRRAYLFGRELDPSRWQTLAIR